MMDIVNQMKDDAARLRNLAFALEELAEKAEKADNLPAASARTILYRCGFCAIHKDSAKKLLSILEWAKTQDCEDYDNDLLEALVEGLKAAIYLG